MELFRALAQVATGTGPLLRARPRTRFEATDQAGRIDVVEPEIEAVPPGRPAAPPPSPAGHIGPPGPVPTSPRDEDGASSSAGPSPLIPVGHQPAPMTAGRRPTAPVVPDGTVVRSAASPAATAVERVVHERETHHSVERVRVERRGPEPTAAGPAASRVPIGEATGGRPVSVDRDAATSPVAAAAPAPAPPRPPESVDGPARRPSWPSPPATVPPSRREQPTGERPDTAPGSQPAVVVHIGRLEVRTVAPAKPAPTPAPLHFAGPDLGDFLGATP